MKIKRKKKIVKKVTKYQSQNLLGESPKEEKRRLLKENIKMIMKHKTPLQVKDAEIKRFGKGYLKGTTLYQRKRRLKMLSENNIHVDKYGRII